MKSSIQIYLFTLAIIIATSCSKSSDVFIPDPNQPVLDTNWSVQTTLSSVENFLLTNARTAFSDSVQNDTFSVRYYPAEKLSISVPEFAFLDSSSSSAGSRVSLEIKVIRSKGEILRSLISTRSNTDSGNINMPFYISIRAYRNGNELSLRPGKLINIQCDHPVFLQGARSYYASPLISASNSWTQSNTSNVVATIIQGTNQTRYYYNISKTGWSSCGVPYEAAAAKTKVYMTMPIKFTNVNTKAFIVLNNSMSVIKMKEDVDGKFFYLDELPVGSSFKIVSISIINGVYYLGIGEAVISPNLIIQLRPVESSPAGVNSFLNSL
jgi:hypothetical protein